MRPPRQSAGSKDRSKVPTVDSGDVAATERQLELGSAGQAISLLSALVPGTETSDGRVTWALEVAARQLTPVSVRTVTSGCGAAGDCRHQVGVECLRRRSRYRIGLGIAR